MSGSRLAGHELAHEGAAFKRGDRRGSNVPVNSGWSVSGTGYAVCSCGVTSPVLSSGAQRKQWHREHKDAWRA